MTLRISAAIPTRNRPDDLAAAVQSILAQRHLPDELIIVDQSIGPESRDLILSLTEQETRIRLVYIHDPAISGLVPAKKVAAERFEADILCFLEDDVVLEPEYLEEMAKGFVKRPEMLGCCGVVTNLPPLPLAYCKVFQLFHRGIFRDPRVGVHGYVEGRGHELIPSRALSGGLSAWRGEVFASIPFDVVNDFFMLEDIDYSTRAEAHFGSRFFINPNARLAHNMSPINRARLGLRQRRKLREFLMFYKKRHRMPGALAALLWLLPGLLIEALFQSFASSTASPLGGYFAGIVDGVRQPLRELIR